MPEQDAVDHLVGVLVEQILASTKNGDEIAWLTKGRAILAEMVRWLRVHWARPELAKFQPVELVPGAGETDDEIIDALVRTKSLEASFAHMSGSCAMMPEALGGVVGSDLSVYGVRGLSVVDASIIPLLPATHLQATMYAVAEKAADLIKLRNGDSMFNPFSGFFRRLMMW